MPNTLIQLQFQVCPIILSGGIAAQIPGAMLPMLSLFNPGGTGLDLPFDIADLDDAFGAFNVLPGGTLISQSIGKYPFANQYVAANAVIEEPLTLSIIMDAPMRGPDAWAMKFMIMSSLKATLDMHNNSGGTYSVSTPAYLYENLVLTALTDNSRGNNSLPQNAWRFDFEKPLIALQDLQGAQNSLMSKMSNGLPTDGNQSGIQVPAQTGQTNLSDTIPTIAGLTGGRPALALTSLQTNRNYTPTPALPIAYSAGIPFNGIS